MKSIFRTSLVAAAALGAAMFAGAPAEARTDFSISIGVPNAVQYDYSSGGYCDSYGCPDSYWDFPVWYGPVYWRGTWYRGPVYYRDDSGRRQYWIAGGWHHDQWRGSRPDWWSRGRYYAGPALGYDYYRGHGFRHDRDRHWRGDNWRSNSWRGHDNRNGDNSGLNLFLGGDRHDHHGNGNRDWNDRHGDGQNSGGGHDGNDRHDHRDQQGNNGNWQNNGSGRDANGHYDHGGNSGWSQQHDQRGVTTTTTASPAAVYNAQTGNTAHGSNDRSNNSNNSGNDSGDHHHHHHDQNDNNNNNGH